MNNTRVQQYSDDGSDKEKTCNVRMARRAGPRKGKEEQKKEKSKERRVACWRDADGRRWIDSAFL